MIDYLEYISDKQIDKSTQDCGDYILTGGQFWTKVITAKHPVFGLVFGNIFFTDRCSCIFVKSDKRCPALLSLEINQN